MAQLLWFFFSHCALKGDRRRKNTAETLILMCFHLLSGRQYNYGGRAATKRETSREAERKCHADTVCQISMHVYISMCFFKFYLSGCFLYVWANVSAKDSSFFCCLHIDISILQIFSFYFTFFSFCFFGFKEVPVFGHLCVTHFSVSLRCEQAKSKHVSYYKL